MPTSPASSSEPRRHSIWRWLLIGMALCVVLAAIAIVNLITLGRDAVALRKQVFAALDVPATTRVQVNVGPVLLTTVRTGLHFIKSAPPEARQALAAVRAASVGVYALRAPVAAGKRAAMFAAADAVMNRRGWIRIVGVNDHEDTVLVYTPAKAEWGHTQRVCLAVCSGDELVVVAATANTDALAELAAQHGEHFKLPGLSGHGVEL
ncbi:MAG TPA: hypothetical protein VG710_03960 [Opitutus sp.]|nr:hypothetical protein [Opitutus sp.]